VIDGANRRELRRTLKPRRNQPIITTDTYDCDRQQRRSTDAVSTTKDCMPDYRRGVEVKASPSRRSGMHRIIQTSRPVLPADV